MVLWSTVIFLQYKAFISKWRFEFETQRNYSLNRRKISLNSNSFFDSEKLSLMLTNSSLQMKGNFFDSTKLILTQKKCFFDSKKSDNDSIYNTFWYIILNQANYFFKSFKLKTFLWIKEMFMLNNS